jgi:hypothetical protein
LYEGESAVVDLGVRWTGPSDSRPPVIESELFVFVDFRPVKFGLVQVDGDPDGEAFPTVDEVADTSRRSRSHTLTLTKDVTHAYTLVLPPEVLGERGAHDVRIVSFRRRNSGRGIEPAVDRTHTWATMTVNYGGTTFAAGDQIDRMDARLAVPPEDVIRRMSQSPTLLVPAQVPTSRFTRSYMDKTYGVDERTVRLKGWMEGLPKVDQATFVSVVMRGDKMIEGSRSLVTLPHRPSLRSVTGEWRQPNRRYAARFDLSVPLPPYRESRLRMVSFRDPLCGTGSGDVRVSNAIRVRSR